MVLTPLKLVRFAHADQVRLGALLDDGSIVDLNRAYAELLRERGDCNAGRAADFLIPPSLRDFLANGDEALVGAREALDAVATRPGDVSLLRRGVVCQPTTVTILPAADEKAQIICAGRNYSEHAREGGAEDPELPILFVRLPATLLASGEAIVRPHVSTELDWEGELAVVISQRCRYVAEADAMDVVGGYTIFNDVSVRDYQRRTPQWTAGKNFMATGPLGPHVVPSSDIPDPQRLDLAVTLNGELMQHANTAEMIFGIRTLIAHASEFVQLEPGDIIATGTPSGVGFARTPPRFLKPGDHVCVKIDGIGTLENPVVDEDHAHRPPL